jgi:hypothetical protein
MKIRIVTFLLLPALNVLNAAAQLVTYPVPEGVERAPEYSLEVNGQEVFVYNTRTAAFACFSFDDEVEIKVNCHSEIYEYDIRPQSRNISSGLYRNQISFSLNKPENLSIEINKNLKRPLFIFANPLEENVPTKNSRDVVFFEAGKIHYPGEVRIEDGQTVYIQGGAVVKGHFLTDKGKDIVIKGRGIIDNSHYSKGEHRPVEINQCENVLIEGIIITNSRHWSCASFASENVTYENVKIVSANDWDDGIDIVGSKNVMVTHCFIRTKDDCIAIKSGVNYFTEFNSSINVDHVVVQNSVLWNGVWGNGLEIGFETRTDTIQNITFRNCDLIHVEGPEGTFTIHNGDRAIVKNVLYEDIRVEDSRGWLIDFKILESRYSKDTQRGKIENIRFKNIYVEGEHYPSSQLIGFDDEHMIKNVTLENFNIHGVRINSTYNGMIAEKYVTGLVFK